MPTYPRMHLMDLDEIRECLRAPRGRSEELLAAMEDALRTAKQRAVAGGNQDKAKEIWCLETILFAQMQYTEAFEQMKAGSYYDAWCTLEEVEIKLGALARHHPLADYHLEWLVEYTRRFQGIYPYKKFISTGYFVKERRCGLCDAILTPRTACHHRKGEIYDGEMCFQRITSADVDHIALVDDPVHKSCIVHLDYNFALVEYVVEHLESPFDGWTYEWTKIRHSHGRYAEVASTDPCPCESGTAYKDCCLSEPAGVLRPHFLVNFEVPPKQQMVVRYV